MNTSIINTYSLLLLALVSLFTVTGCDKDDHDHDHDHEHGHVHLYFNQKFGTDVLNPTTVHTAANGREYTIDVAQYYISNLRLVDHDGGELAFDSFLVAKIGSSNGLELDGIPAGHYTTLKFDVGLDSSVNHADPNLNPAGSALALQSPSMHWGWDSGYIFVRIDGTVDTSATKDGPRDFNYNFHLGRVPNRTPISLPIDLMIDEDSHPGININFDASKLFDNIDLGGTERGGHGISNNADLVGRFRTNIGNAFSVE